jgi:hypothetical protein
MSYSMQIEMGLTDLFSLEPVDSRLRNYSRKSPSFVEQIEEENREEKEAGVDLE